MEPREETTEIQNPKEKLTWQQSIVLYLNDLTYVLIAIMLVFLLLFRVIVVSGDSMEYLKSVREKFDLVLLDPPYAADLLENAIAHLARFDILAPHGIIVAEHPVEKAMPALAAPYRLHRTYRSGKISLTVYRRDGNQNTEE